MKTSITEVAESGSRLETLKAMRAKLAAAIDDCESTRDLSPLCNRLCNVMDEIYAIEQEGREGKRGEVLDEIISRHRT